MRNFTQRMRRVRILLDQQRLARRLNREGRTPAEVIRERRLRRLAALGRELPPAPPRQAPDDLQNPPQTLSEGIRRARFRKRLAIQAKDA